MGLAWGVLLLLAVLLPVAVQLLLLAVLLLAPVQLLLVAVQLLLLAVLLLVVEQLLLPALLLLVMGQLLLLLLQAVVAVLLLLQAVVVVQLLLLLVLLLQWHGSAHTVNSTGAVQEAHNILLALLALLCVPLCICGADVCCRWPLLSRHGMSRPSSHEYESQHAAGIFCCSHVRTRLVSAVCAP